jgi:hypothetical protein
MAIELGTAEKESFQTPRAALAQHPRTTSLPAYTKICRPWQTGDKSTADLLYFGRTFGQKINKEF